jgi:hypothetical protein
MRAAEARARADEMKEVEPKAIMLRIAADYEELSLVGQKRGEQVGAPDPCARSHEGREGSSLHAA